MIKIKSPVTWIGNKTSILHILYALFPIGCDRYVEPFGGSGAVLLGKPVPDKFEVFNDYNHNLVNLFRCIDLQIRIAEIDAEFKKMLDRVSTDTIEDFDEETAARLMNEKSRLQQQLDNIADAEQRRENAKSRLDDIYTILDGIKNRPMEYDDQIVRQLLECVVVDSKEQITVIFKGGLKSVQPLTE